MIYVTRNSKQFGPYDTSRLAELVHKGVVIRQDEAIDTENGKPDAKECVGDILRRYKLPAIVENEKSLVEQVRQLGSDIIISKKAFKWSSVKEDKRLLLLVAVGLFPLAAMSFTLRGVFSFYLISLYFASIWGLFFYYMFKTKQVKLSTTLKIFFAVQGIMLVFYGLGLNYLNFFYELVDSRSFIGNMIGYVLGVGVTEEFVKAIPLYFIAKRSKTPLIPQTMVFYGLMCGTAFGVYEGVEYQVEYNIHLDYNDAFFANIARLTSLPFFHAMCTGLAGYFIAFAVLYPRYRRSMYLFALAMPAVMHGLYDTFAGYSSLIAFAFAVGVALLLNYYIRNDKFVQSLLKE